MASAGTSRAPERIRAHHAATILGVELRTVQALAARGELPGAAKIGGLWTFDESALRLWIMEKSACLRSHQHQNIPTGAVTPYGRGSRLGGSNIVKAYEQAARKLLRGG